LLVLYALLEIGYRTDRFHRLESAAAAQLPYTFSSFESPLDVLDTATGFAYKPNTRVHQRLYDPKGVPTSC
jgi:hypothetical protein